MGVFRGHAYKEGYYLSNQLFLDPSYSKSQPPVAIYMLQIIVIYVAHKKAFCLYIKVFRE